LPAPRNQVLHGDASKVLRTLSADSIDCTVTSPPYYRQRDYADKKQLGQEATPQAYIERLVAIFAEVRRVTKETGSLWLNLGDKYDNGKLLGLPWRVALALADEGWILRSDCIWQKPNAMPSPVANRPTIDHEYLFLFAKSDNYFYNADAVREPHVTFSENSKMKGGRKHFGKVNGTPEQGKNAGAQNLHRGRWDQAFHPLGRNKRTVWSIPLSKFRDAHFAVFPESLVETCIKAACPTTGLVLDPFCGSGTTLVVAKRLGRRYLGIDCASKYVTMARKRVEDQKTQ
jgi:DNA modification methylase